jgi:vacuolar-type H+-ATPase subunit I/STV1
MESEIAKKKKMQEELMRLRNELREREQSVPAHSIRPHQLLILEELEEKIGALEREMQTLEGETQRSTS